MEDDMADDHGHGNQGGGQNQGNRGNNQGGQNQKKKGGGDQPADTTGLGVNFIQAQLGKSLEGPIDRAIRSDWFDNVFLKKLSEDQLRTYYRISAGVASVAQTVVERGLGNEFPQLREVLSETAAHLGRVIPEKMLQVKQENMHKPETYKGVVRDVLEQHLAAKYWLDPHVPELHADTCWRAIANARTGRFVAVSELVMKQWEKDKTAGKALPPWANCCALHATPIELKAAAPAHKPSERQSFLTRAYRLTEKKPTAPITIDQINEFLEWVDVRARDILEGLTRAEFDRKNPKPNFTDPLWVSKLPAHMRVWTPVKLEQWWNDERALRIARETDHRYAKLQYEIERYCDQDEEVIMLVRPTDGTVRLRYVHRMAEKGLFRSLEYDFSSASNREQQTAI
jgi:hypothetical protein